MNDTDIHLPPPLPLPAAGVAYTDPVFGSVVRRITSASPGSWIGNEYSSICPYNQDCSRLILIAQDHFREYFTNIALTPVDLPDLRIGASQRPKWAPAIELVYFSGNELHGLASGLIHKFSEYVSIDDGGEADLSEDGNHLVLCGDGKEIFVFELSSSKKGPLLGSIPSYHPFDSLYLTPDLNVLISWSQKGTGRYCGMELYDRDMNFLYQIASCNGHKDVMRGLDGKEYLIWTNSDENPVTLPSCPNGIIKSDLSTGEQTCLLSLPWSLAVHISCPDHGDYCYVSTEKYPEEGLNNWTVYANEILRVHFDGTVDRIAHHRSRLTDLTGKNNYNAQPKVSCSRDGSRIVWSSSWGSYAPDYCDTYECVVDAGRPSPVPPPVPALTLTLEQVQKILSDHWPGAGAD